MKISNRLGVVATSLLLLAVGVTCLQTGSFAKRDTPKKKVSAKWNGAVIFKQDHLVCTDEKLLSLNGYKEPLDLASFYVCFSGDSDFRNDKFHGIQLYFLFMSKKKALRYDVVMRGVEELKKDIGKNPDLKVVVKDEEITLPWKEVVIGFGENLPRMITSVEGLGGLLKAKQLSLVARDRKTKIIVAATSLGEGPPAGGVADPGDFIVKPTPTPPPPAP